MGSQGPLPKFDSPPIVETVLGVEFTALDNWDIRNFGFYWNEVKDHFSSFEVKPALESRIEDLSVQVANETGVRFSTSPPELRGWFVSNEHQRLVQIQRDRFIFNWRKGNPSAEYPEYEKSIRPDFEREFKRFSAFLKGQGLGPIEIVQCEVTYVNHLERGIGWSSAADLQNVFKCWSPSASMTFLPAPEDVSIDVRYRLPNEGGRLYVSAKPAIRNEDGVEILQMTLTARGRPAASDLSSALEWLDIGREWIVQGFTDFTTKQMHDIWKRRI